jgi:hypothetical protein
MIVVVVTYTHYHTMRYITFIVHSMGALLYVQAEGVSIRGLECHVR